MRIVPPVASLGLWTPLASSAWLEPPPAPPPLPEPVVLGPPHAASATEATALSASAVSRPGCLLVLLISTLPRNSPRPGIQGVAKAVAEQVEREHGHEDRQTGPEHEPRVDLVPARGVGDHAAPRRG